MDFIGKQQIVLIDNKEKVIKHYYSPPSGLTIPQLRDEIVIRDGINTIIYVVYRRQLSFHIGDHAEEQTYRIYIRPI